MVVDPTVLEHDASDGLDLFGGLGRQRHAVAEEDAVFPLARAHRHHAGELLAIKVEQQLRQRVLPEVAGGFRTRAHPPISGPPSDRSFGTIPPLSIGQALHSAATIRQRNDMSGIGIISNPKSLRNRRDPSTMYELRRAVDGCGIAA